MQNSLAWPFRKVRAQRLIGLTEQPRGTAVAEDVQGKAPALNDCCNEPRAWIKPEPVWTAGLLRKSCKEDASVLFARLCPPSLQNGCCFDAKHSTIKSAAASITHTASERFPQPPDVPPVLHFHRFLTLPGPQKAAEASSKCLLHCKTPVLPRTAAPPSALCPCPLLPEGAVRLWPAGCCRKDPFYLVHNLPPSSASLCWSQMFTLATHAVSWPETLISPWHSNTAFPRILRAAQPGLCRSCPPGIPAGFGGCSEHGGKGLVLSRLFICLVL